MFLCFFDKIKISKPNFFYLLAFFFLFSNFHKLVFCQNFSEYTTIGFEGKAPLEFSSIEDVIVTPNNKILVAECGNNRIQIINSEGKFEAFITSVIGGKKVLNLPFELRKSKKTQLSPEVENLIKHLQNELKSSKPGLRWYESIANITTSSHDTNNGNSMSQEKGNIQKYLLASSTNIILYKPIGLALDGNNRLWISCSGANKIYIFDLETGKAIGEFGGYGKEPKLFFQPADIDISNNGYIAVADRGNCRVQIFDSKGEIVKILYYKEELKKGYRNIAPYGVLWLKDGNLLVSYPDYHQVVAWDLNGNIVWRYGKHGSDKGELNKPTFLAHGLNGRIFISDTGNHRFVTIDHNGKLVENYKIIKGTAKGRLISPKGLAFYKNEELIVADSGNSRIQIFKPGRVYIWLAEAKNLAAEDNWEKAYQLLQNILNLQPDNQEARYLMANALHYFGDMAFQKADYTSAEEYYRRILFYNPDDRLVPQKLDSIFWASNQEILIKVAFGIVALIIVMVIVWIIKQSFIKILYRSA